MFQVLQVYVESIVVPAQLALAMLGMGASLSVQDFLQVARERRGVLLGLALQLLVVPACAVAYANLTGMGKGWATGLLLVAVSPGGAFSNLLTLLGRGNTALSVAVTGTTTLACLASVPVLLRVLAGPYLPPDFEMPTGHIVREIGLFLLLPLFGGMLLLRAWPERAAVFARWAIRLSTWMVALVVVSSLGSGRIRVGAYGWVPPVLLSVYGTLVVLVMPLVCRVAGCRDPDSMALTIEVLVRNVGLSLLLVHFFFPGQPEQGHVLYTVLFYGGMQLVTSIPTVLRHRAGKPILWWLPPRPAEK